MKILRTLRIADFIIFAGIVIIILWTGLALYGTKEHPKKLIVETPSATWVYPLTIPQTVKIPGVRGITEIRIEHDSAMIISSACPNKTCIAAPPLKKHGDWNACLPNKVFLHIEGDPESETLTTQ